LTLLHRCYGAAPPHGLPVPDCNETFRVRGRKGSREWSAGQRGLCFCPPLKNSADFPL